MSYNSTELSLLVWGGGGGESTMEKMFTEENSLIQYLKCDHCGVKRFVCLMYNCTDLNICTFCSSDKLSSPNSKVSISKLLRNCRLFVNGSRASTYKQHSRKKK